MGATGHDNQDHAWAHANGPDDIGASDATDLAEYNAEMAVANLNTWQRRQENRAAGREALGQLRVMVPGRMADPQSEVVFLRPGEMRFRLSCGL